MTNYVYCWHETNLGKKSVFEFILEKAGLRSPPLQFSAFDLYTCENVDISEQPSRKEEVPTVLDLPTSLGLGVNFKLYFGYKYFTDFFTCLKRTVHFQ